MTRGFRLSLALAVMIGAGGAHGSHAQTPHSWSADAAIGGGTGHGGEYFSDGSFAARLAVSGRVLQHDKFAVSFEGSYDWFGFGATPLACALSLGSGCRPRFPRIQGLSGSTGLVVAPWARVEARAGIGVGAYSVDETLLGALVGQLDAAVFPVAHVGLVLGTRSVVIPRYRGDRLTMIPVLFGVRLR